jgi:hypothetical protein
MATITPSVQEAENLLATPIPQQPRTIVCSACAGNKTIVVPPVVFDCPICAGRTRDGPSSPFVFVSERGSPFTTAGFARMIERAARCAMPSGRAAIADMRWPCE